MHPVITDQLEHHAVAAQAVVDSKAARPQLTELLFASYRLFRNFAVLCACGLFESPKHMAQAILSSTDATLRETFPHAVNHMEAETSTLDLDEAIDNDEEFTDATLFYIDGLPFLRTFDTTGERCDGFNPSILQPVEDDEEDEPVTGPDGFPCSCAICEASKEPETTVFSAATLDRVEAELNEKDTLRYGELSEAHADYNHLRAKELCGVAMTEDEREAYPMLHGMIVEEAAARIAKQRAFERQRAREIAATNEAREATAPAPTEGPTFKKALLQFAASYVLSRGGRCDMNLVARVIVTLMGAPPSLQQLIMSGGGFASLFAEEDTLGLLFNSGMILLLVFEAGGVAVFRAA